MYDCVIKINPKYIEAYYKKGLCYNLFLGNSLSSLEEYDEAIEQYDRAIQFDNKYIEAYE